jgi:hypothetical protein
MDCLSKHSLSYIFKSIIGDLVEDFSNYCSVRESDEWKLILKLDASLENHMVCEDQCLGCLEYGIVVQYYNNFASSLIDANSKSQALVSKLCEVFALAEVDDPILLAFELTSAPSYVTKKIPVELVDDYECYVSAVSSAFAGLSLSYYNHKMMECNDTILSHSDLEQRQVVEYTPVEHEQSQVVFYLDQNFVSQCVDNPNLKKQLRNYQNRKKCMVICSPYLIEDGIKMNQVRFGEYLEAVVEMTGGVMLAKHNNALSFVQEDIKQTARRVALWTPVTRAAENHKFYKSLYNQCGFPQFARNSPLSRMANDNIDAFLQYLRPHMDVDIFSDDGKDPEPNSAVANFRILNATLLQKSVDLGEIIERKISADDDFEIMEKIEHLCEFLDYINYKTESLSNIKKIRSSLQDAEHLKHAWKADYIVTNDARLRTRGKLIYSMLGLKTEFLDESELKAKFIEEFRRVPSGA